MIQIKISFLKEIRIENNIKLRAETFRNKLFSKEAKEVLNLHITETKSNTKIFIEEKNIHKLIDYYINYKTRKAVKTTYWH